MDKKNRLTWGPAGRIADGRPGDIEERPEEIKFKEGCAGCNFAQKEIKRLEGLLRTMADGAEKMLRIHEALQTRRCSCKVKPVTHRGATYCQYCGGRI